MCAKERLSVTARKQQICEAAKNVFLAKGFAASTMEDIVTACGLSKGGLYYHYHNTTEILHDLMLIGNKYRYALIQEFIETHKELSYTEMMTEIAMLKIVDSNEYKSLYAMFLLEAEKNEKLKQLYIKIMEETRKDFLSFITDRALDSLACLANDEFIAFMNSMIVATELLDVRTIFLKKRDFFKDIILHYIQKHSKKNIK